MCWFILTATTSCSISHEKRLFSFFKLCFQALVKEFLLISISTVWGTETLGIWELVEGVFPGPKLQSNQKHGFEFILKNESLLLRAPQAALIYLRSAGWLENPDTSENEYILKMDGEYKWAWTFKSMKRYSSINKTLVQLLGLTG